MHVFTLTGSQGVRQSELVHLATSTFTILALWSFVRLNSNRRPCSRLTKHLALILKFLLLATFRQWPSRSRPRRRTTRLQLQRGAPVAGVDRAALAKDGDRAALLGSHSNLAKDGDRAALPGSHLSLLCPLQLGKVLARAGHQALILSSFQQELGPQALLLLQVLFRDLPLLS